MSGKKLLFVVVLLLLAGLAGCSFLDSGLSAGDTEEGDLRKGVDIGEILPGCEDNMLVYGVAVDDDWPALEYPLKATEEGLSLFVEADRVDPVIVVVDADGNVLAVGDDWDERLDAFVSIDVVPKGAKAVVFDVTGSVGTFVIEADAPEPYSWKLAPGVEMEASILEDKDNDLWEEYIRTTEDVFRDQWETARLFPLEVSETALIQISVESDIDCVMLLLRLDGSRLVFTDFNDDTNGVNPFISDVLEPGNYLVVVDTYEGHLDAEFTIDVSAYDPEEANVDVVRADSVDEWYEGRFFENSMIDTYMDEPETVSIDPRTQAVVFEFDVEDDGVYRLDAVSPEDTRMLIIDAQGVEIDSNDDGPEGYDPQIIHHLSPGSYSAIVVPFDGRTTGTVRFRYSLQGLFEREAGSIPFDRTFGFDSDVYMTFPFEAGNTYEIFAESQALDLTLTVVDAAGERYFSDDENGQLNPYLEIPCTEANAGDWEIDLTPYMSAPQGEEARLVVRKAE